MQFPKELKYTKDHEWAKIQNQNVTVGITEHAQSALGDIVFVDLPKPGRVLKQGEVFGVVESIKAVSELYAPVAGKILEVNAGLVDEPAKLNQDPHGTGWILKMESPDAASHEALLSAEEYQKLVESL